MLKYVCAVALTCVATSALAVENKSAPYATKGLWTGPYVGAQAGYGWGSAKWYFPVDSYFTLPTGNRSFTGYLSGGLVGAQLGYLYQIRSYVLGLEAAYQTGGLNRTVIGPFSVLFPKDTFSTSVENIRTLTARFGYAFNHWQVYVKGGVAGALINIHATSAPPGGGVIADQSHSQYGWAGGLGVEYLFTTILPNTIAGIEYNFTKLRDRYYTTQTFGTPSTDPFVLTINNVRTNSVTAHLSVKLM